MRTVIVVILAHILGLLVLLAIGIWINDWWTAQAGGYTGITTVFSAAFGVYSFAVNILYQKNRWFYLLVNRLRLALTRTHTFWQPGFDFELGEVDVGKRQAVLECVLSALREANIGRVRLGATTATTATVYVDDLMCLQFRLGETNLNLSLDRKLLVPAHLYGVFAKKLARIAELVQTTSGAVAARLGVIVSFGEGAGNPYFGFFVSRVPGDLLENFEVRFLLDRRSTCHIEAGADHVTVDARSVVDFAHALSAVLSLHALPVAEAK